MRKLLFVGVMFFCATLVNAQDFKETILKGEDEDYNNIDYLEENYGHIAPGEVIKIEPIKKEIAENPPPTETKKVEPSSSSRNVTSSGSSRSSTQKSSSRKRAKRKKVSLKRKRPKRMKRKRKLGNRAICPRF